MNKYNSHLFLVLFFESMHINLSERLHNSGNIAYFAFIVYEKKLIVFFFLSFSEIWKTLSNT